MNIKFIFSLLILLLSLNNVYALREARPMPIDNRLRVIVYNPEDVFKFTGFYGYQASIEFDDSESIESISMGDSVAWQLVPSGKRLFLKPVEQNATTNMTLITNKRVYHFELHAKEAVDINDPEMVFNLKFIYADENVNPSMASGYSGSSAVPDLTNSNAKFNFSYTISGADNIAPIKIFDDGEFTYFEFKDKNAELPAFFLIDSMGKESLVNYRIAGKYVVIERVASRLTLRNGTDIVCVFNEIMPMEIDKLLSNEKSAKDKNKSVKINYK